MINSLFTKTNKYVRIKVGTLIEMFDFRRLNRKYRIYITLGAIFISIFIIYIIIAGTPQRGPLNTNSIPTPKLSLGGKDDSALTYPLAVAIGKNGQVYVSSSGNNQVKVFETDGKFSFAFGQAGRGVGQFNTPYGIGFLPDGTLLVSDMLNYRIQRFDKDGKFLGVFLSEKKGIKPGILTIERNEVYVSDLASHQIVVLNSDGEVIRQYTGGMNFPQGLARLGDNLLVADAGNNLLKLFSSDKVQAGKVFGNANNFKMLRGLAIDKLNRVLVVDSMQSQIKFLSENGAVLFGIGSPGNGQDQLMYPAGIAIDRDGNIYIADWGNNRIQVWGY